MNLALGQPDSSWKRAIGRTARDEIGIDAKKQIHRNRFFFRVGMEIFSPSKSCLTFIYIFYPFEATLRPHREQDLFTSLFEAENQSSTFSASDCILAFARTNLQFWHCFGEIKFDDNGAIRSITAPKPKGHMLAL